MREQGEALSLFGRTFSEMCSGSEAGSYVRRIDSGRRRQAHPTESVYEVVLQKSIPEVVLQKSIPEVVFKKSIPAQIRQLILYHY